MQCLHEIIQANQPTLKRIYKDIHEIDRDITVYWMSMVSSKLLSHFAFWWNHVTSSRQWIGSNRSQVTKGWVRVLSLLCFVCHQESKNSNSNTQNGTAWVNHRKDEGWSCLRVIQFSVNAVWVRNDFNPSSSELITDPEALGTGKVMLLSKASLKN